MKRSFGWLLVSVAVLALNGAVAAQTPADGEVVLPKQPEPFAGKIGRTAQESTPAFPKPVTAPAGAPNILVILTDDVGFGAASSFGGPVPTPVLDRLAANGLRYTRFHTTAMCSPTRAGLLTGRNHHAVATGTVTDLTTGYPGYWSIIPKSAATVAEVLRQNGYNTAFFGKHHNVPDWQASAAGPFDLWPTGLGFEYFYGFIGGDTDQWRPKLYRGVTPAEPRHAHDPDYILDRDLADDALHWIHNQKAAAPDRPFFAYYAPGSAHAPHQAPKAWIDKFRGRFDQGWDRLRAETFARQKKLGIIPAETELTPRSPEIPAWDSLSPEQKRVNARMMEVYAAMLAHQDAQIGRIISELERMGQLENTLIIFIEGDNGASPEGGPQGTMNEIGTLANGVPEDAGWLTKVVDEMGGPATYQGYPVGWAWATNAPFQWTKQVASHLGGTRNGLVISWPKRIKDKGGLRTQFHHVVDIMPTILEVVGVPAPTMVNGARQQRIDGISMAYSFDAPKAADRRNTQYFEMLGNRAIYHDGWLASTTPNRLPWKHGASAGSPADYRWELYDLRRDFSQARDLAAKEPAKLKALQALFDQEAERNNVFPLDDRMGVARARDGALRLAQGRASYVYWGKDVSVSQSAAPPINLRSFSLTADVVISRDGGRGVLLANGSQFGGWSFHLDNGRPVAHHAFSQQSQHQFRVASDVAVPAGPAVIRYDFDYDRGPGQGGQIRISIDGREVARGRIDRTTLVAAGLGETFDVGRDTGVPVVDGAAPFNGEVRKLEVTLR